MTSGVPKRVVASGLRAARSRDRHAMNQWRGRWTTDARPLRCGKRRAVGTSWPLASASSSSTTGMAAFYLERSREAQPREFGVVDGRVHHDVEGAVDDRDSI